MQKLNKVFLENLKNIYTKEELKIIKKGFSTEKREVTFRINLLKGTEFDTIKSIKEKGLSPEKISGIKNAYKLVGGTEKDLWDLPLYKAGFIYVQSLSSQIPVTLFDFMTGDKVLDLAAAPGGKTSQISSLLGNSGEIIAVENNAIRVEKLKYTLSRQGVKNTSIIKKDARNFEKTFNRFLNKDNADKSLDISVEGYFDKILFDAPCSSEGRINLNSEKTYASLEDLFNNRRYYKLQRDIIKNNIKLLKIGGELIYSTCTLSALENEAMVHFLLSNFPELEIVELDNKKFGTLNIKNGISQYGEISYRKDVEKSIRILPSEQTEGFFIAKFIKK